MGIRAGLQVQRSARRLALATDSNPRMGEIKHMLGTLEKKGEHRSRVAEITIVLLAFLAVNVLSARFQPRITYHGGRAWDGVFYYKVAQALRNNTLPTTKAPFVYRAGVPFLAAMVPHEDLLTSFLVVNVLANTIAVLLLMIWIKNYIDDWRIRTLVALLFIVGFNSMPRMVYFAPVDCDYWDKVLFLAGLILISKSIKWSRSVSIVSLTILTMLGALFREIMLVIAFSFLFRDQIIVFKTNPIEVKLKNTPPFSEFIPLIAGLFILLLIRYVVVVPTGTYTFGRAAARHLYTNVPPLYLHGWFIAFGPIIALPFFNWRRSWKFLMEHQFMLVYLLIFSILGYIGGQVSYRMVYWAFPVVFVLIGKAIEDLAPLMRSWWLVLILGIAQLVSQRAFWVIPDYPSSARATFPIFTPIGNKVPLLDVLGIGNREIISIALFEYVVFFIGILWYLRAKKGRLGRAGSPVDA
jgi:hypothetical protein